MRDTPFYNLRFSSDDWYAIKKAVEDVAEATKSEKRRLQLKLICLRIDDHFTEDKEARRLHMRDNTQAYRDRKRRERELIERTTLDQMKD